MTNPTPNPIPEWLSDILDDVAFAGVISDGNNVLISESIAQAAQAITTRLAKEVAEARRDGEIGILRGFRRRDFVREDFYEHAVIDRLATLIHQPESEEL